MLSPKPGPPLIASTKTESIRKEEFKLHQNNYPAMKLSKQESENNDTVCIEVGTSRHYKLATGTVYRPPKQQAADDESLYEEIQTITQNKQSAIIRDFNCSNIDWITMNGDKEGNRLLEMLEDSFLSQIVTQPTKESNLLYLVFVNDCNLTRECQVGEKLSGCDHHLFRYMIRKKAKILDYGRGNFNFPSELLTQIT